MASIRKEIFVHAGADVAWDAIEDFGAVHRRLGPGFVVECQLEQGARVVKFANGTQARELLVDCDASQRRLVYAIIGGRVLAHSASMQVYADGEQDCRILWITDVLPNELADYVDGQMEQAAAVMKRTLESSMIERGA